MLSSSSIDARRLLDGLGLFIFLEPSEKLILGESKSFDLISRSTADASSYLLSLIPPASHDPSHLQDFGSKPVFGLVLLVCLTQTVSRPQKNRLKTSKIHPKTKVQHFHLNRFPHFVLGVHASAII